MRDWWVAVPDSPAGTARLGGKHRAGPKQKNGENLSLRDFTAFRAGFESPDSARAASRWPAPGSSHPLVVSVVPGMAAWSFGRPNPRAGRNHGPPNLRAKYTGCGKLVKRKSLNVWLPVPKASIGSGEVSNPPARFLPVARRAGASKMFAGRQKAAKHALAVAKPASQQVTEFLNSLQANSRQKIFVHCHHGADRTGVMVAAFRSAMQKLDTAAGAGGDEGVSLSQLLVSAPGRYIENFPQRLNDALNLR